MERYRVKIKKDYSISAEHGEHMFRNSLEWSILASKAIDKSKSKE